MDDGIGLPEGFNNKSHTSMGINLMKGLSEDIDGSFTIQSDNGTIVTVSFIYSPDISKDFTPSITGKSFTV
jgi:two-component sensor histidine kinase